MRDIALRKNRTYSLIITGCIAPPLNIQNLQIRDIDQRLNEYKESISWALCDTPFQRVIFCDNSGYDLSTLGGYKDIAIKKKKELEILSFKGDSEKVSLQGKGYGEGEIIKYVLENSILMSKCDCFYKLTGRLKISNIKKILDKSANDIYFNLNYPYHDMFDTRFYKISVDYYKKYFLNVYEKVNDANTNWLERVFFNTARDNKLLGKIKCYPYPVFVGNSGSTGLKYYINDKDLKIFNTLCYLQLFNNKYIMKILRLRLKIKRKKQL